MSTSREVEVCSGCGAKNRLSGGAPGQAPRCARCSVALPWRVAATTTTFADETSASVPVLVDFWAEWCGPCKAVEPTLTDLSRRYAGRVKIVTVDVDAEPELARRFRVQGIPALFLLEDGAVAESWVGVQPPAVLEAALQART